MATSRANMWRRQIRGTPNWTPGPRIVDTGHVDIVIKHPRTAGRSCRWEQILRDANIDVGASGHNRTGSSPPQSS